MCEYLCVNKNSVGQNSIHKSVRFSANQHLIVIDLLAKRQPFFVDAARWFSLSESMKHSEGRFRFAPNSPSL